MILSVKLGGTTPYPVTAAGLAQCAVDDLAATDSCVANYLSQFSDCKATACRTAEACPIAESLVQPHLGKASAEILKSSFKSVALQSFGYGMPIITEDQQSPILVKDGRAAVRLKIITTITQEGIDFRTRSEWGAKEAVDIPSTDWNYHSIALHHAGNSFGCLVDGAEGIRSAEAIDINSFGHLSYHYAIDCQGIIYEALDIRNKGAHIEGGNTGVVGVVFLADFSVRGEVDTYGPGVENVYNKRGLVAAFKEWLGAQNDNLDVTHDEPTQKQLEAADVLISTLLGNFPITILGGHREFAQKNGTSRACPGVYGMIVADIARRTFGLSMP